MRRWRLSAVLLSLFSVSCLIIQSVSAGPEAVSTGSSTSEPNGAASKSGAVIPAATTTSGDEGGSASIGTLIEEIHCEGFCLDLDRSRVADERDAWLVYVVTGNPVVVQPLGQEAYLAAARLKLQAAAQLPYQLVQLYDDPPQATESPLRDCLREIEVDPTGNVYVLNVHRLNENCILWKYASNGTVLDRIGLMDPNRPVQVEDPIGLHISRDGKLLYVASAQRHPEHPDSTVFYGFFTEDFSLVRTIAIADMQQVTSLAEADNGILWVTGFNIPDKPTAESYAWPCLAKVYLADENVQATYLSGPNLTVPMSMVWTGEVK